jgi:hypothetical protein
MAKSRLGMGGMAGCLPSFGSGSKRENPKGFTAFPNGNARQNIVQYFPLSTRAPMGVAERQQFTAMFGFIHEPKNSISLGCIFSLWLCEIVYTILGSIYILSLTSFIFKYISRDAVYTIISTYCLYICHITK